MEIAVRGRPGLAEAMHAAECHHEEGVHPGLKGHALRRALAAAQAHCQATQERLTEPRRRVLQLLLEADAPLKAYDLIATYGEDGRPPSRRPSTGRWTSSSAKASPTASRA